MGKVRKWKKPEASRCATSSKPTLSCRPQLSTLFFDPQGILSRKHGAEGEALVGEASAAASGAEVAAGRAERS